MNRIGNLTTVIRVEGYTVSEDGLELHYTNPLNVQLSEKVVDKIKDKVEDMRIDNFITNGLDVEVRVEAQVDKVNYDEDKDTEDTENTEDTNMGVVYLATEVINFGDWGEF